MTFRLLPKDVKFFDLFIEDGDNLALAAGRLHEMVDRFDRLDERVAEIQALEQHGDEIDREINRRLEDAFITPFDREDIHELTVRARRRRRRDPGDRRDVRDLRRRPCRPTRRSGWRRSSPSSPSSWSRSCAGSTGSRASTATCRPSTTSSTRPTACRGRRSGACSASEWDPLEVIKWRDLYAELEETIDAAEDAAEVIERMNHKSS